MAVNQRPILPGGPSDLSPGSYSPGVALARPVVVERPVVIDRTSGSCNCNAGSGFEQKIKENPMVFVLGALLVGYLLAKS